MFSVVRELKSQGVSVIYISHKLEEIDQLCQWVTVLRDGQIIDSKEIGLFTRDEMITKMIGREITNKFPKRDTRPGTREVLKVEGLSRKGYINQVGFSLYEGEVLGVAGLVGAGRTEIARAICGIDYRDAGTVWVDGRKVTVNSPEEALKNGLAYLSEDRKQEGLVVKSSVKWNLTMAGMKRILSGGMISGTKETAVSNKMVEAMRIKTPGLDQQVVKLSGGNQQKIVIGKWLNTDARIFIFDEPTRGIDVGAKYEIYLLINELVKDGKSVILISSEMPEVVGMSDRVLVVKEGRISGTLVGQEINAKGILEKAI